MGALFLLLGKIIACGKLGRVPTISPAIMTLPTQRCRKKAGFFLDGKGAVINGLSARLVCRAAP
jgi:hypothetical protein